MGTIKSLEEFERKVVSAIERYAAEEMPGLPINQMGTPSLSDRAPGKHQKRWPLDFRVSYHKQIRLTDSEINKWWDIMNAVGKHHGIDRADDELVAEINRLAPAERASKLRSLIGESAGKELDKGAPGLVTATFVTYGNYEVRVTYLGLSVPTDG